MEECRVNVRRIVTTIDLSEYSETTFVHAVTLARAMKAELVVLNIINSRNLETIDMLSAQGYDVSREKYVDNLIAERTETFQKEYLSRIGDDVNARLEFRQGLPWEEIIKALRKEDADIVVMGTKGRGALAHVLFGSTAEKVFRHSPCTVISVRGPEHCRLPDMA